MAVGNRIQFLSPAMADWPMNPALSAVPEIMPLIWLGAPHGQRVARSIRPKFLGPPVFPVSPKG